MPVGAAVGVAAGGIAGSAISASKNSKAIGKATDAQTAANDKALAAQEKARSENLALQRPIYDAGMPAIGARNALLGLGGPVPARTHQVMPNALAAYNDNPYPVAGAYGGSVNDFGGIRGITPFRPAGSGYGIADGQAGMDSPYSPQIIQNAGQSAMGGISPQQAQEDAFDRFRKSTGYKFRIGQANDAFNSGYAANGWLQSGDAVRERDILNQNLASAEFGNYWGMLGEQQALAPGAANAMSGVNTTYANNAGNLAVANGNALANSAVAKANNTNALIGGGFNALSQGVGILAGAGRI